MSGTCRYYTDIYEWCLCVLHGVLHYEWWMHVLHTRLSILMNDTCVLHGALHYEWRMRMLHLLMVFVCVTLRSTLWMLNVCVIWHSTFIKDACVRYMAVYIVNAECVCNMALYIYKRCFCVLHVAVHYERRMRVLNSTLHLWMMLACALLRCMFVSGVYAVYAAEYVMWCGRPADLQLHPAWRGSFSETLLIYLTGHLLKDCLTRFLRLFYDLRYQNCTFFAWALMVLKFLHLVVLLIFWR